MQFMEDLNNVELSSLASADFSSTSNDGVETQLEQIEKMQKHIEEFRDVLVAEAKQWCARFYSAHKNLRDVEHKEGRGFFGTRVRRIDNSLSIVWYRNRLVNTKQGVKTYSNHLKKGQGFRYPKSAFRGAKKWEMEIIEAAEDRYALIRERWSYLTVISRELSKLRTSLEKQGEALPDFSFLEQESFSSTKTPDEALTSETGLTNNPIPDSA